MTALAATLKGAVLVDFTGTVPGFQHLSGCGEEFAALVRAQEKPPALVVIDAAVGATLDQPVLVRDHLNLTGSSPLLGPNHPAGERFPVVQGIYIEDRLPALQRAVVAGLKPGIKPTTADLSFLQTLGASVCTYNMVPSMIICAHARTRLLGIVLPENGRLPESLRQELLLLSGES